jgi:hypothetical protein
VPAASEVVVVTARVHDPDGVQTVTLNYRVDPAAGYTSVPMLDNGTGGDLVAGDGLYSATIPGQAAGALVAFQVNARDTRGAVTVFPQQIAGNYALPFEALVRFGDPTPFGGFGTYRQWLTAAAINAWASRAALSNEKVYGTFVNGNFRVIYNMTTRWNGSPYHQFGGTPAADGHYTIDLPEDDQMFGTTSFHKIHFPGNGPGDDNTIQREQTCYWFARQLGLPYNYRRNVNMIFNGARRGGTTLMMEDTETPGNDVVNSRFSDDADGDLYKLQPWFEEDVPADPTARTVSPGGGGNSSWCLLNRFTTPSPNGPIYKTARYRNNYLVRAANGTANDYAPVFAMVDAVHTPTNGWAAHTAAIESLIDIEEWTRIWAVCHAVGDWDHVGTQNAQNMYGYKPTHGKWNLMIWDMNIVLGNSGSWGAGVNLVGTYTSGEDTMQTIYANPKFRRMFFRGLKELATGPMVAANVATLLDAKYAAYVASGVTPTSPGAAVKGDIASRVTSILSTVATEDASTFKITGPSSFSTNNNLVTISGEAPVEAATIRINGISYPIIWNSVKAWTIRLAVNAPLNELNIQAYDLRGNLLANFSTNVTVIYNGATIPPPETTLVINEIMYNPAISGAGFVEIYNNSSFAYDLSNWRLNGASYAFPYGSVIAGRQYLVLANDPVAFVSAYGGSAPTFDTFDGSLDNGGETLSLERPTVVGTDTVYVAVNRVEYDDDPPWPASADGFGPSLQLIDANQDNARVSNWSDGGGWRFFSNTGTPSASTTSTICRVYMEIGPSDIYIDDLSVVAGSVPGVGPNFIQNGDFEGPLTTSMGGPWAFSSSLVSNSVIDTTIKHSGNGSLHLIQTGAGAAGHLFQNIAIPPGTYTISYWYLPATNEYRLITYLSSAFRPTNFVKRTFATPGTANSTVAILPPYDRLWLNELQANNLTGPTDNHGEHDPWIELYNAGPGTLDLSGYYLANNFTNLTQWQFSAGTMIAPGEFKIVWADGQPEQTAGTTLHTSFRLGAGGGSLALSRLLSGAPQITDCINYPAVAPDLSYGDFPDGQPIDRQVFFTVTPGTTNSARDVTVFINEWMASNTGTNDNPIADPADGHFDDWFELYNPGNDPIDLKDYYLTDDLADPRQYMIPAGYVVPPHGFLLVWADNDTNQNSTNRPDLHVSFQLSKNGEAIGLFAPNGSTAIDTVTFGPQTNDVSQGRFADGAETIYFMTSPTPGQPNTIGQPNTPPTLAPIPNQTIRLGQTASVTAMGNDVDFPMQTLTYSLDPGFPFGASIDASTGHFLWTPTPSQAPSTNNFTVRVTDNGSPHRSATGGFTVIVRLPPRATISNDGSGHMLIGFDTIAGRTYRVEYKEHLDDPLWNPLGPDVVANGDNLGISDNIGPSPQRFYRIRQVN